MDSLRLGDLHRKVSETSRKTSVLLNQESNGSDGILSDVSCGFIFNLITARIIYALARLGL